MKSFFSTVAYVLALSWSTANAQTVAVIGLATVEVESTKAASGNTSELAGTIAQRLLKDLISTRKFKVLNYQQTNEVLADDDRSIESVTDPEADNSDLDVRGLDYIVEVKVLGYTPSADTAKIELSLLSTSFDLESSTAKTTVKLNKNSNIAASTISSLVVTETIARVFPVRIMDIDEEGLVKVNYGKGFLTKGEKLKVYASGKVSNGSDSNSNEELGEEVATLEIVDSDTKFSSARVTEGNAKLGLGYKARKSSFQW